MNLPAEAPRHGACQLCGKDWAVSCGACAACLRELKAAPTHRRHRRARQIIARRHKFGRAA